MFSQIEYKIENTALLDQLRKALHTDTLTDDALLSLSDLEIDDPDLTEVKDLFRLTGLQTLRFASGFQIPSTKFLVSLERLSHLKHLDLSQTDVDTLFFIEKLSNLESLRIDGTQIRSLSSLSALTTLTLLTIKNTWIYDLYPLIALTKLSSLDSRACTLLPVSHQGYFQTRAIVEQVVGCYDNITSFFPLMFRIQY
ncbi:hypothetical protein GEMRC1_011978 [Eukaryota sp. GEM-RC1]